MKRFLSHIRKRLPSGGPEGLSIALVVVFLFIGLYVTFSFIAKEAVQQSAQTASWPDVVLQCMLVALIGFGASIVAAPFLAGACAFLFMRRTVKEAYPAALLMKDFGLEDDDDLVGFIRQRKLRVYRTKQRLPDTIRHDVAARLEPLFSLWIYFPFLPSKLIAGKRICFDRREIDPIKKHMLDSLLAATPEALEEISKEKDTAIAHLQAELQEIQESSAKEKDEAIASLRTELQEFKEVVDQEKATAIASLGTQLQKLKESKAMEENAAIAALRSQFQEAMESADNERRDLKKRLTSAGKQVNEYLFLGYAGMRLVSVFFEIKMEKRPGRQAIVTKARINEELANLRHEEPLLEKQLARWQRSGKAEQNDEFYDFLRLALPNDMVNWGGYAMTFAEAVEKYFKTTSAAQTP